MLRILLEESRGEERDRQKKETTLPFPPLSICSLTSAILHYDSCVFKGGRMSVIGRDVMEQGAPPWGWEAPSARECSGEAVDREVVFESNSLSRFFLTKWIILSSFFVCHRVHHC
ncbi:unnamed protein product [Pleuronectes platessa]|uniref:Uncharacterized protein n=1 Tax=Pleuronectes platessa TaxID=8262 RepID=A0A9N7V259_PLEPL|nr:unnamed protein product [Pleuronectes platessa]